MHKEASDQFEYKHYWANVDSYFPRTTRDWGILTVEQVTLAVVEECQKRLKAKPSDML